MPEALLDNDAAFRAIEPLLASNTLPLRPRLPTIDPDVLLPLLLGAVADIRSRIELATSTMTPAHRASFEALLTQVVQTAKATVWAHGRHSRQVVQASAFRAAVDQARPLRAVGLHWMEVLENLGVVPSAEAGAIRSGRGHLDAAGDLEALGVMLERHWALLEPLQPLQTRPELRVDAGTAAAMKRLASDLRQAERSPRPADGEPDWRQTLLRCYALLEHGWDKVRLTAAGGYAWSDQIELARDGYPTLLSLQRQG